MLEGQKLVQQAPESPDVRLVVVRVVLEDLRGHVVGSPDARAREVAGAPKQLFLSSVNPSNTCDEAGRTEQGRFS